MSYRLEFSIPMLPKTTNAMMSMHWRKKGEYTQTWHLLVAAQVCGKKPAAPLQRARLTLVRFSSTEPDYDGLVSSFKPVIDGLRVCGVLVDDKFSNIGKSNYEWKLARPKHGAISVLVEELP